jgi:hypothetical protein
VGFSLAKPVLLPLLNLRLVLKEASQMEARKTLRPKKTLSAKKESKGRESAQERESRKKKDKYSRVE